MTPDPTITWTPHAHDCACSECDAWREADASIAADGSFIARCMLAGFLVGLAIAALHGWWTGGPGVAGMVGL